VPRLSPFRLLIVACVTALIAVRLVSYLRGGRVPSNLDSQPTGSASITGRVVDGAGKPIGVANVRLASENPRVWRSTTTDADGRFTMAKLPAADYQIVASKKDYLDPLERSPRPRVTVATEQRATSADLTLVLGGTISGTVYGEDGKPLASQFVRAIRAGQPFLGVNADVIMNRPLFTGTDDHGRYTVAGLPADDFYIAVSLDRAETMRFYHPAASRRAEAKTVSIKPGEALDNVDIRVRHVVTTTLTVLVSGPDRKPIAAGVELLRADDERRPRFSSARADGKMILDGVAPDRYWITAHTIIRDHEHWAMKVVDVSEQPISTTLVLEPDAILTGSVALEKAGSKSTPALTTISIFFRPADGLATAAQSTGIRTTSVEGDGRFVIQLPPGRYIVEAPVAGWTLARAVVNGRDTLASPIAVRAGTTLTAELTLAPR
jgi:hypothetical protein